MCFVLLLSCPALHGSGTEWYERNIGVDHVYCSEVCSDHEQQHQEVQDQYGNRGSNMVPSVEEEEDWEEEEEESVTLPLICDREEDCREREA